MSAAHFSLKRFGSFFIAFFAGFVSSVFAASTTWGPAGYQSWNNAANWSNGVPVAGVDAVIANNGQAGMLSITGNAGEITVGNSTGHGLLEIFQSTLNSTGTARLGTGGPLDGTYGNNGTAAVFGSSVWNNSGNIHVGETGRGGLIISGGSIVRAGWNGVAATGTVTLGVSGTGGGTLTIGNGGSAGTLEAAAVVGGAGSGTKLVLFNQTDSTTFAPDLMGSLSVQKTGVATTILTGSNSYTGATTIGGGTLRLEGVNSSSGFAISSGAVLELSSTISTTYPANTLFTGTGTLRKTGNASGSWGSAAATFALSDGALIDVQGGTFVGGSNGNEVWTNNFADLHVASGATFGGVEANVRVDALTGSGTISSGFNGAGYQNFTFGVANGSGAFSGLLSDNPIGGYTAHFVKTGTGTQTLSGSATYSGTTTISAGTLVISGNATPGNTTAGTTVASGAVLALNNVVVGDEALTLAGSGIGGNGALVSTGTSSFAGPVTVSGGVTIGNTGSLTFSNSVNAGTLTKIGAGTVTFGGSTDNVALAAIVSSGTLVLGKTSNASVHAIGGGSPANLIVQSGAVAQLAGTGGDQIFTGATVQVNTGGVFDLNGRSEGFDVLSGTGTITNTLTSSTSTLTIGEGGSSQSLTATLQNGAGVTALAKSGVGTLTLTASSSYSGGTTITGGTLAIATDSHLGNATGGLVFHGGTLRTTGSVGSNRSVALNSGGGTINISLSSFSNSSTQSGNITGSGALTKTGPGVLFLAGSNSYTGGTNLNEGITVLNSANALGSSGTLSFNGGDLYFTAANTTDYSGRFSSAPNQNYRVSTGGQNLTFASNISSAGGMFRVLGGGSLTLTGSNSFSAGTTLSGATLVLGSPGALGTTGTISMFSGILQFTEANTNDYSSRFVPGIFLRADTNGQNVTLASNFTVGEFHKLGSGTLTLSGTVTGSVFPNVNAGTLQIAASGSFSSTEFYVTEGAALDISGGAVSVSSLFLDSSLGNPSSINLNGGALTASSAAHLRDGATSVFNITAGTFTSPQLVLEATLNQSGGVVNASAASLVGGIAIVSGGTWTSASNLYVGKDFATGVLSMTSGTVSSPNIVIGRGAAFFTPTTTSGTATVSGGLLTSTSNAIIVGLSNGGQGTLNIAGGAVTAPGLSVGLSSGAGSVFLSAGTLSAPSMNFGVSGGIGNFTLTGGTATTSSVLVGFEGGTGSVNVSGGVLNSGALTIGQSGDNAALILTGGTIQSSSALIGGNVGPVAGTSATISGGSWQISGNLTTGLSSQATTINMTGGTVSAANGYLGSGTTTVSGGALTFSSSLALDQGQTDATLAITGSGNITVASGTGVFLLGGSGGFYQATLNVGTGGIAGTLNVSEVRASGTNAPRIVNFHHTGTTTFAPRLSGTMSVSKLGAGTTILTGSHSYVGPTTINAGKFLVNGTISAGSSISVNSGGQIGGRGEVGAITVAGGGSTYPGDPQVLTAESVNYQNGSSAQFALFTSGTSAHPPVVGADYDRIALTGGTGSVLQIAANTTLQLNLTADSLAYLQEHAGENALDRYFLFTLGAGTSSGQFSTFTVTQGLSTYTQAISGNTVEFWDIGLRFFVGYTGDSTSNSLTGGNDITLTAMVIPEPTTAALLLLGGLGWMAGRRGRHSFSSF